MPYKKIVLPEYPAKTDVWDMLAAEKRPIMVYGMGNGADKLFLRFEKYGITPKEIFASDGFVRGHSYRGYLVKSFSEIKNSYREFAIVVSFASNRCEVVDMLSEINESYDLYMPDMPIADPEVYFDKNFYNENYDDLKRTYDMLADEDSKNCYAAVINYKLSGRIEYLLGAYSSVGEIYSLLGNRKFAIDVGAYNGDTVREMKEYFPELSRIIAIEPDKKNFKRLKKYADFCDGLKPEIINAAAHREKGTGYFSESGNRNSTGVATASYESETSCVELISIDSLGVHPDYVKFDVEGGEYEALLGSERTIRTARPCMLVSLYHKSRDLFTLPMLIKKMLPDAKLYLRRIRCLPAWELDLIVK